MALVVMPFAAADRPSLAAGLLKASLAERGIACDVKHFNLTFWKMLGHEAYRWFAEQSSMVALAGEWVFSQALFGQSLSTWESYQRDVLDYPVWGIRADERARIPQAAARAPEFLDVAFASTDWSRYDVVGFTSTFQQTLASLALARRIRRAHPGVVLVAGGANFEGGMGRPYLEALDLLDYVATGESETSFPELCAGLREGRTDPPAGFLRRHGSQVVSGPAHGGFTPLDALPAPDYDDYFRVLRANDPGGRIAPWMQVEASRGCWWGAVSHCTFCGLNGDTMTFRTKDWRRVVAETDGLLARHGAMALHFADNILAMSAYRDLLPFWAARRDAIPKFVEVKSNLRRSQVAALAAARVTSLQPGIESLSDRTLKLMKKGVTAAQNVAFLRWCAESGIEPLWNLLFGFPGEDPEDGPRTERTMRSLVHLRAPEGCAPIRLDRFSPNFERHAEFGFTQVAPIPAYRHLLPMDDEQVTRAAYFFVYEHPDREGAIERGVPLMRFADEWRDRCSAKTNGRLALLPHLDGGRILVDDRFTHEPWSVRPSQAEEALLLACDAPVSRGRALDTAARHVPDAEPRALEPLLDRLIERAVIAEAGAQLVTLALLPEGFTVNGLGRAS